MEKYASHGWMIADTYNSLIAAFGKNFDFFSFRELASFCSSLAQAGLRQSDIISEWIQRISQTGGRTDKDAPVVEGEAKSAEYFVSFKNVIAPIFKSIVDLDLVDDTKLIE